MGPTLALFLAAVTGANAQQKAKLTSSVTPPGTVHRSLRNEVDASIDRGLDWLAAQQKPDGSWSNGNFPALTALPLQAFVPSAHTSKEKVVTRAVHYLQSCAREDGSIYKHVQGRKGGGLMNYNTAICMTALHATGDPSLVPIVQKARAFLAESQHLGGDIYEGGFGYDRSTKRAYTDLMNTYYAAEAMRVTQDVEDLRAPTEKRADINWKKTIGFIERMQSKPESGADNAGGFAYNPTSAKAGLTTNEQGIVFFRSYGSITYAGLLALIYAEVAHDDRRVLSALDWSARHWSLHENPGMGQQGLFFFYSGLTKALTAAGRDLVPLQDGAMLNWREALAEKIVSLQRIDPKTGHGFWKNDTGRFWENAPVLATSYCLIALENL